MGLSLACHSKPENGSFRVQVWKPGKSNIIFRLETGIFKPAFFHLFSSKLQVWLLSALPVWCSSSQLLLRNLNSILGLLVNVY